MDLQEYTKGVLATESRIEEFAIQPWQLDEICAQLIRAAQKLDEVKKRVYYAKAIPSGDRKFQVDPRVVHGIIGVATEAGELLESLVKAILGPVEQPVDAVHLREECGDICWYVTVLADALGSDLGEVLRINHAKLMRRYKQGQFTAEEALNRDLAGERQVLEDKPGS